MRSRSRVALGLALALSAATLSACSGSGAKTSGPRIPAPTARAWDSAYLSVLHGVSGSFRSEVVGTPCPEPIGQRSRGHCVVGGARISEVGVFTLAPPNARYEHHAYGLGAGPTEQAGYRVLAFEGEKGFVGSGFVSALGRTDRGGCWGKVLTKVTFGSQWLTMPAAFSVLLNADAESDPVAQPKAMRLNGVADAATVLEYLGVPDLYTEGPRDTWTGTRVPIELRLGEDGLPSGFSVDGRQVAEALVGPEPSSAPNAPAAFSTTALDPELVAEVWNRLAPLRGQLELDDLGSQQAIRPPPARWRTGHYATGDDDPCPARH